MHRPASGAVKYVYGAGRAALAAAPVLCLVGCGSIVASPRGQAAQPLSGAHRSIGPAVSTCATMGCIYVTNSYRDGFQAVNAYPLDANGNVPPLFRIGLGVDNYSPGVALDSSRNVYVANDTRQAVTVYAAGSSTVIATIAGPNTGLNGPHGVTIGLHGNTFVANAGGSVTAYPAGANGNVTPFRTIMGSLTGLSSPYGIATDWYGVGTLYVANLSGGPSGNGSVTVYAAGANGNVAPVQTVSGSMTGINGPYDVAVDGQGEIYVANAYGNSVTVYAAGANGNVAPLRTLSGHLSFPTGVVVGARGILFVVNQLTFSVMAFAKGASGGAPPIRTIEGRKTLLYLPSGLAVR